MLKKSFLLSLLLFCITFAYAAEPKAVLNELLTKTTQNTHANIIGNPTGDVTVLVFTDYNCPYCKEIDPLLSKLAKRDGKLRIVMIDYPVVTPESSLAARAAIAATAQGKYQELHDALMAHTGNVDESAIFTIAKKLGLDLPQLKEKMAAPATQQQVESNLALGNDLGIMGTPTIIAAGTPNNTNKNSSAQPIISFGYINLSDLQHIVAEVRKSV